MKTMLLLAVLALFLVGCRTNSVITEPSGAQRSWDPAQIDWNHSAVPVSSSTDKDKHIWTQSPVPTVPPRHDEWRVN